MSKKPQKSPAVPQHANRKLAALILTAIIAMVSFLTSWWLTRDDEIAVHLIDPTKNFISHPMTAVDPDRG